MENKFNLYNSKCDIKPKFRPDTNLKNMEQVKKILRYNHYARKTEQTYCEWILKFIRFFNPRVHPKLMEKPEIE